MDDNFKKVIDFRNMVEGGGYSYPSVFSPLITWLSKVYDVGYDIDHVIFQLDHVSKYTGLNRSECEKHARGYYESHMFFKIKVDHCWCDGWTKDDWVIYNRHMKLQNLGI